MRRWLAIILLALLPLQFSWAAVAAYCGHEPDAQAQHVGHHEHQHHADSNAGVDVGGDDHAGKPLGSSDPDCGPCHGCCLGMPVPIAGASPLAVASGAFAPAPSLVRTLMHSPPERPQWRPLA